MSELEVRQQSEAQTTESERPSVVYTPRFDVSEDDHGFVLSGDLPGVTPEGLDIQYKDQELTIWGKVVPRNPHAKYWVQEYGVGDYYRAFTLGESVDAQSITAQLKDGVLTVHLPKKEEARPRRIEVQVA